MTVRQVIDISPNTPYYQLNAYSIGGVMSTFLYVRGLFVALYLIATLIVCNALQMISFVVFPFSPKTCRKLNRYIAGAWWGLLAWSIENVVKIKIHEYGDKLQDFENAIVLPNHQASADIPVLLWLAWQKGMVGNMKWFVKHSLRKWPGIGWGLWLLGCPFVKRNWQDDKAKVNRLLGEYQKHEVPIWMISFLEGTRTNAVKLAADREKSIEAELKPLMHHMYPKRAGIVATVQGLRSHVRAVYDVEILYHNFKPTVADLLFGRVQEISLHIMRIPIDEFPEDDDGVYARIVQMFHHKDAVYAEFHNTQGP